MWYGFNNLWDGNAIKLPLNSYRKLRYGDGISCLLQLFSLREMCAVKSIEVVMQLARIK